MKVFRLFSRRKDVEGEAQSEAAEREDAPAVAAATAPEPPRDAPTPNEPTVDSPAEIPAIDPEGFDDELETAFQVAASSADGSGKAQDAAANRELFVGIAQRQAKPVKNFVRQLQRGATGKDLIDMCRPVLDSTLEAATGIDLDDVARCLTDLDDALSLAQAEAGNQVEGEARDLILACYQELESQLPEAFSLDDTDSRRDTIIVHSLLRQIPEVGHVTLQKLYAAGFTSIDVLVQANHEDLAVTTGIREDLAESIYNHVQRHHEAMWGLQTEQLPTMLRRRLSEGNDELRKVHESFEATSTAEATDATLGGRKRDLRRTRQACLLRLELTIAELDALDLLEQVQKLPYAKQIETIDEFLARPIVAATNIPQGG